jgi:Ca2+-transporting ATPase
MVMLFTQFTDILIVILIIAAVVAALIGDVRDALPIIAIVIINAIIGFSQAYKAENSLNALKKMAGQMARIIRDGHLLEVEARTLVTGDFLLLEAGTIVPADLRLVETVRLQLDEAALTGESLPVEKHVPPLAELELPLGDRLNMAYMGTVVVYGRGAGIVVATGMSRNWLCSNPSFDRGRSENTTPVASGSLWPETFTDHSHYLHSSVCGRYAAW